MSEELPTPHAEPAEHERVVYRNATVNDGRGGPSTPRTAVVVAGPEIVAVLPDDELTDEHLAGAEIVDLTGRFLLPGLIDAHQHLTTPANRQHAEMTLRCAVYGGVTAIREMAGDLRQTADLARAALVGEIPAPDIEYAALMAGPSFFTDRRTHAASRGTRAGDVAWLRAITEDTDLALAVAQAKGTGATAIKIYSDLPPKLVAAITAEAHRQGMKVWAHATVYAARPSEVVAAGVDVLSHTSMLVHEWEDEPRETFAEAMRGLREIDWVGLNTADRTRLHALFAQMAEQGTVLDATLSMHWWVPDGVSEAAAAGIRSAAPLVASLTADAHSAGVRICAGTDATTEPDDEFPPLHRELLALAETGMCNTEIIRAATLHGAVSAGREDRMGTIAPGKLANLVVLAEDPVADIANVASVVCTVKRGRRFDRADFARSKGVR